MRSRSRCSRGSSSSADKYLSTSNGTVPSAFAAQCRLVWANVEAQLHAAEMTLDNVVDVTTFLADRAYGMENRVIRKQVLGDLCPASTTIIADIFDAAWLIEVKVVAAA